MGWAITRCPVKAPLAAGLSLIPCRISRTGSLNSFNPFRSPICIFCVSAIAHPFLSVKSFTLFQPADCHISQQANRHFLEIQNYEKLSSQRERGSEWLRNFQFANVKCQVLCKEFFRQDHWLLVNRWENWWKNRCQLIMTDVNTNTFNFISKFIIVRSSNSFLLWYLCEVLCSDWQWRR